MDESQVFGCIYSTNKKKGGGKSKPICYLCGKTIEKEVHQLIKSDEDFKKLIDPSIVMVDFSLPEFSLI